MQSTAAPGAVRLVGATTVSTNYRTGPAGRAAVPGEPRASTACHAAFARLSCAGDSPVTDCAYSPNALI